MLLAVNANSPFTEPCNGWTKCVRVFWQVNGSSSNEAAWLNRPKFSFKSVWTKASATCPKFKMLISRHNSYCSVSCCHMAVSSAMQILSSTCPILSSSSPIWSFMSVIARFSLKGHFSMITSILIVSVYILFIYKSVSISYLFIILFIFYYYCLLFKWIVPVDITGTVDPSRFLNFLCHHVTKVPNMP